MTYEYGKHTDGLRMIQYIWSTNDLRIRMTHGYGCHTNDLQIRTYEKNTIGLEFYYETHWIMTFRIGHGRHYIHESVSGSILMTRRQSWHCLPDAEAHDIPCILQVSSAPRLPWSRVCLSPARLTGIMADVDPDRPGHTDVQSQKAVTAHLKSEQLLPFSFAGSM